MGIDLGIVLLAFFVLLVSLVLGVPVALGLTLAGVAGVVMLDGIGAATSVMGARIFTTVFSFSLTVIPLFVLMGFFVNHARIGEDLFALMSRVGHRIPGGMGLASIGACAGFGAVTGASVTGVATIGPIAIREMRRYGYSKEFSAGLIAAAGTLGILIPPSIALVLYGFIAEVSIGRLLIAGFVPGLFSAVVYGVMTVVLASRRHGHGLEAKSRPAKTTSAVALKDRSAGEPTPTSEQPQADSTPPSQGHDHPVPRAVAVDPDSATITQTVSRKLWENRGLIATLKVALLFAVVFGGIYFGFATVTESAALGALAALIMLIASTWREGVRGVFARVADSVAEGVSVSSMFFLLLVGGSIFGYFLLIARVPSEFARWATGLPVPPSVVVLVILLGLILLGMFLDGISILLIAVPLTVPIVVGSFDYDAVWYGVMVVKTIEIGLITPPLGINAYVVSGLAPDIPVEAVFRGVIPFFVADVITLAVLFAFPDIVTWLPNRMLGG
jgi:C4-dicarboxylate transporter, DctM subunit